MPAFEVWRSPGGKIWAGADQEDALLIAIKHRQVGSCVEVAEIYDLQGQLRPRRIAVFDDRKPSEASR